MRSLGLLIASKRAESISAVKLVAVGVLVPELLLVEEVNVVDAGGFSISLGVCCALAFCISDIRMQLQSDVDQHSCVY